MRNRDPDALLLQVQREEAQEHRGRLKIFFGFAPGVGKTFAMLGAAKRLVALGVDVVVACVETHGRKDTEALVTDLETLPQRTVQHRGTTLLELDLEGALARRPKLVLVDELAHSNAPGSRHPKRHHDVRELLDAGIDVFTTLNVQHVESLNDVVAQITGVRVRETVPDAILDRADEIELVDIPPDELLKRLAEGKVYVAAQATRARDHFFRRGNLLALRELALRRTADHVDADVVAYRDEHAISPTWPSGERILVCVGPGPGSARLIRSARRMSAGLHAPWTAAFVELDGRLLSDGDRERLTAHLKLAESLGGEVVRLSGARASSALVEHARKTNVSRILLGKPTHPRIRDVFRGSLLDEVVRASDGIDVLVISGDEPVEKPIAQPIRRSVQPAEYGVALAGILLATLAAWLLRTVLSLPDIVMLYLVAIALTALRTGRGPALLASLCSVAAFDFFFVPPFFTFAVSDTRHLLTFSVMFLTGLLVSTLTLRLRGQERDARSREERTAALYAMSRDLGRATTSAEIAVSITEHAYQGVGVPCAFMMAGATGPLEVQAQVGELELDVSVLGVASWVREYGRPAGFGTDTLPGATVTCFPLPLAAHHNAVLIVATHVPTSRAGGSGVKHGRTDDFLEALLRQGALALERARLSDEAKLAALRAKTEEMRSSLLSAVSHDLRTPLAAITGAATTLRDSTGDRLPEAVRADLLETICEEAERLERLVANLLDMTRLESGALRVKRDWVPFEEMLGSTLNRLESQLLGREVITKLPDDLPFLSVDPVLFEQVLVNLLENVAKYTPTGSPIEIVATATDAAITLEVSDRGPGVPAAEAQAIFEKFYRGLPGEGEVHARGAGLGLAICRGIVEAHGGSIQVVPRAGGGATFRVMLARDDPKTAPSETHGT